MEVPLRNSIKKAIVLKEVKKPSFSAKEIKEVSRYYFPPNYQKIIKFISEYYVCSYGEACSLFTPFETKEILTVFTKITNNNKNLECFISCPNGQSFSERNFNWNLLPIKRRFLGEKDNLSKTDDRNFTLKELSQRQNEALNFIEKNDISLLFGDTGSGKTEIYIHLMAKVLKKGKNIIFLMPEISLTSQMQKRLESIFGKRVALWHSKITKKRKNEIIDGLKNGSINIIAGARSALFLPVENLGLIVVDEEHDSSYKSNSRPRYNARDLAVYFGKVLKCKVVLGSATPSLTSYHKYPHFRLKGSYAGEAKEYIYEKNSDEISPKIIDELDKVIKEKKQAVIFLPTRANFKYISCFDCGEFVMCPFCSVGLSLHKDRNALVCHYCGYAERIVKECPSCGSTHLESFRMGTEEVKEKLSKIFPKVNIAKFDRDAIKSIRELDKVLKEFNDKKVDIFVGTQMLSKGHDYAGIGLSVILGIDTILAQNDYKARENALSLAVQIAGRSGRADTGRVILQTSNKEFFKKYMDDFELFLKDELKYRKELYPPFKKLSRILISHKDENRAKEIMQKVKECLRKNLQKSVEIVGSGEANIKKIASKYRYHILLRSVSSKALLQTILSCKQNHCEVDMDPISFS